MSFPYPSLIPSTGTYSLENSLGATRDLDWSYRLEGSSLSRTVPRLEVLGRFGARKAGPTTVAARELTLTGLIQSSTAALASTEADELEAFLSYAPVQLKRNSKYLEVELLNFSREWENEKISAVNASLIAQFPLWVSEAETSDSVAMAGTADTLATTNDGSFHVSPVITVTVTSATAATFLTITNDTNGDAVTITSAFADSDVFVLDTDSYILTKNGTRSLSVLDDDFFVDGFRLETGANSLSIASDATFNGTIEVSFRERFFAP